MTITKRVDWLPVIPGSKPTTVAKIDFPALRGQWAVITPSWAREVLKGEGKEFHHPKHRLFVEDMKNLDWRATGETIVFSPDNHLLNGRKRLAACIEADTPFVALIIQGVPEAALDTQDNLRGRTLCDALTRRVEGTHRKSVATFLQIMWRMRAGVYDAQTPLPSSVELISLLDNYLDWEKCLIKVSDPGRQIRLASFLAICFFFRRIDEEAGDEFIHLMCRDWRARRKQFQGDDDLSQGALPATHPIRVFNDLIYSVRNVNGGLDQNRERLMATAILVWNAWRDNVPLKKLNWAGTEFPRAHGWNGELNFARVFSRLSDSEDVGASEDFVSGSNEETSAGLTQSVLILEKSSEPHHLKVAEVLRRAFPDGKVPEVRVLNISDEEAGRILLGNVHNRDMRPQYVDRYTRDFATNRFVSLNGNTIIRMFSGELLNGQHRLVGLQKSVGVSLPFIVVTGVTKEAYSVMDLGRSRNFAQVLKERAVSNYSVASTAVRMQWFYELNNFSKVYGYSPSNPELLDVLDRHPGLGDAFKWSNKLRNLLAPKVSAWLEYHLYGVDPTFADYFFDRLAEGDSLPKGSPIHVLREKLIKMRMSEEKPKRRKKAGTQAVNGEGAGMEASGSQNADGESQDAITQAALTVMAFHLARDEKKIKPTALRWKREDAFPAIRAPVESTEATPAVN